ncbi:TraB/GumN family protein [bacterium]|nr:TraB/GumN family protein [bacterium]
MSGAGGPCPRHRPVRRLAPALAALALLAPSARGAPLFLWEATGPQAKVTMAGSIHVGRADFFPLPAPYVEAFAAAPVLAVELDPTAPGNQARVLQLMTGRGMLPDSLTLRDRLTPENWERLKQAAADHGLPAAVYERLQPGLAAMVLMMQAYLRQGLDPELGIDKLFLDAARTEGRTVRELETIDAQMALFLDIDDELDDVFMAHMLADLGRLGELTEAMIAAWRSGDAAALDALLQEQAGTDPRLEAWYGRLLDDRNAAMADSVDAWLRGDHDVFMVVGAGHFSGEGGVVRRLERLGWTVTQRED